MRFLSNVMGVSMIVFGGAMILPAQAANQTAKEDYIREPLPPGFQVIVAELEGPVFADPQGHTLYIWQAKSLRVGSAGEVPGKPTCDDHVYRENAGLMSPYPAGLELPEVDTRPSCAQAFPPALASADAKPTGQWSIVDRPDGRKQWAYEGLAVYTSFLDKLPGDVLGGSFMNPVDKGATGALRRPVGPKPNVPPQFLVETTMNGRSVVLLDRHSVYASDHDSRNKSNCYNKCLDEWEPILAADYAYPVGEWTPFERSAGIKQWAFRGQPVYRHINDPGAKSQDGSDVTGWHNVYTQKSPPLPKGLTLKDTAQGSVLGDERGMTLYRYICSDDAQDQQLCDFPEAPQVYRLTVCGGGDADRCAQAFPYALAPVGTKTGNQIWGTMYINPKTGKRATAGEPGALNVYTFRARPLYTFAGRNGYGDYTPRDTNANNWGEFSGRRNGFQIIVFRDAFVDKE